jgi:4-aminobutyrate aminotransferase / (S)-3-amino-2-methylpropionate transaminase / 5-aminovalerate transaminase
MPTISLRTKIPGPKSQKIFADREQHVPKAVFNTTPVVTAKASGALIEDVDGNLLLDFAGGLGALNLGHGNPEVVKAVQEQASKFIHTCFHVTLHEPYVKLAAKLNQITPGTHPKRTMFVNSGAEAVENAVKLARYFTKRQAIIAFEHGFHGRTLMGMTLTSKVKPYKLGFGPFAPEVYRLPYPYLYRRPDGLSEQEFIQNQLGHVKDFLKTQVAPENVAAVIVELVTGEGGFIVMPPDYLKGLVEICREHQILLIIDEVQTGFARTGRMFACDHYGVVPDIMTMAKSLGSGMPIGAVTARADIMDSVHVGGLGGTYGGNPLACAAALATIEQLEKGSFIQRANEIHERVFERFQEFRHQPGGEFVGEVRGLGAMIGLEFVKSAKTREPHPEMVSRVVKGALERGLIVLSAGAFANVVRTLMPLCMTPDELEEGLTVLCESISHAK